MHVMILQTPIQTIEIASHFDNFNPHIIRILTSLQLFLS